MHPNDGLRRLSFELNSINIYAELQMPEAWLIHKRAAVGCWLILTGGLSFTSHAIIYFLSLRMNYSFSFVTKNPRDNNEAANYVNIAIVSQSEYTIHITRTPQRRTVNVKIWIMTSIWNDWALSREKFKSIYFLIKTNLSPPFEWLIIITRNIHFSIIISNRQRFWSEIISVQTNGSSRQNWNIERV